MSWKSYPALVEVQIRPTSSPVAYGAAFRRDGAGYSSNISGLPMILGDDLTGTYDGYTFTVPSWSNGAVGRGFVIGGSINLEVLPVREDWGTGWESDRVLYDLGSGLFYGSVTYLCVVLVRAVWHRLTGVWFRGFFR